MNLVREKIYFSRSYQHCNHYFTAATIITTPPKCSATLCFQGSSPLNFKILKSDPYVYCVFQSSPCKEFILSYLFIFTLTLHVYQIAPSFHCSWTIDSTITTILQQPALTAAVTPIQFPTPPLLRTYKTLILAL